MGGLGPAGDEPVERTPARERWEALPPDPPLEDWFEALRAALAESYLASPATPYRQSGRGDHVDAAHWETTRRPIARAIDRDGDLLDVGCANGLLLESLVGWAAARGFRVRPFGVDFVPELVALARRRLPDAPDGALCVANVWDWRPPRRFDYVRTNVEYVPERHAPELLRRHLAHHLAPGGRLIVCHYRTPGETPRDLETLVEALGLRVAGSAGAERVAVVWSDPPRSP